MNPQFHNYDSFLSVLYIYEKYKNMCTKNSGKDAGLNGYFFALGIIEAGKKDFFARFFENSLLLVPGQKVIFPVIFALGQKSGIFFPVFFNDFRE